MRKLLGKIRQTTAKSDPATYEKEIKHSQQELEVFSIRAFIKNWFFLLG